MTALRSLYSYLQTYGYTGANPAHGDFVDSPAVASQAVDTDTLADEQIGFSQTHRVGAVVERGFAQAVALAERGRVIGGFLFQSPGFPGVVVRRFRPKGFDTSRSFAEARPPV